MRRNKQQQSFKPITNIYSCVIIGYMYIITSQFGVTEHLIHSRYTHALYSNRSQTIFNAEDIQAHLF